MQQNIKLIFVPYAGGSAMIYSSWKIYLADNIEVLPLEIAGRGRKLKEPFNKTVQESAWEIYCEIEEVISEGNYAMFGHSMGSLLVYEVIHLIKANNYPEPLHVFLSGRNSPHYHYEEEFISGMNTDNFVDEIKKIGGTPKEFFENKDLMDVFLPILRADYVMVDQYNFIPHTTKFNCGITYFFAPDDTALSREKVMAWADYTNGIFKLIEYQGGHFFLFEKAKEMCKIINANLIMAQQVSI